MNPMQLSHGERMKDFYEKRDQTYLTRRSPVIIRLDGRAFHSFTKKFEKPFSERLSNMMNLTAKYLCENISGAKCAYVQSDEISILVTDYDRLSMDAWFDYNIQKMVSISASMATAEFNKHYLWYEYAKWCTWSDEERKIHNKNITEDKLFETFNKNKLANFDARVFNVPKDEVVNYFIWRQNDWIRNSVHMLTRSLYSQRECQNKNQTKMHDMLHEKGVNWVELEDKWKNGSYITHVDSKWIINDKCPIFKNDRDSIENLLIFEED
jgi:tRNA(His) guanylyltransferase